MLWNIIRDFFVQYVFGGIDSYGEFYNVHLGTLVVDAYDYPIVNGNDYFVSISGYSGLNDSVVLGISFSDWLSTTATIITLCLLVAFLFLVVRWLFKLVSGLITLRG